jgi:pimeloyl-ACP methyl ester carboxylesterase
MASNRANLPAWQGTVTEAKEVIYTVDGQRIHAAQQGHPNRQVAILIHGWSSSWFALSPIMPMMAQRFSCISIDLPGFGQSPRLPQRASIPAYAELIAKLITEVSDGPVVLVGHSMGGMTSITLALRYPMLVERMVLICPTITGKLSTFINLFIWPVTLLGAFGLGGWLVSTVENAVVGITDSLMRPISFAERTGINEKDYARLRSDARRTDQGRVRAECYRAMLDNNLAGQLTRVEPPTLAIWGAEDNTVPLRDAGVVADEWPQADLRIIPKAGHWPHFETAETLRRMVAAYLGLPLLTNESRATVDDEELKAIGEVSQFLTHSDLGHELNLQQRTRLAAVCRRRHYGAGEPIVKAQEVGEELFIVQAGTVEVWSDPDAGTGQAPKNLRPIATFTPGQMTGELSLLDGGVRSAELRAGPEGATALMLDRKRLLALCEDDPALGTRVLWNIARAMALRVRFILWQLQRANQKASQLAAGQVNTQATVPVRRESSPPQR